MMIAAGVNAKALSAYLGHACVTITFDRYDGHLMPGNEDEAAALLEAYLGRPRGTVLGTVPQSRSGFEQT